MCAAGVQGDLGCHSLFSSDERFGLLLCWMGTVPSQLGGGSDKDPEHSGDTNKINKTSGSY